MKFSIKKKLAMMTLSTTAITGVGATLNAPVASAAASTDTVTITGPAAPQTISSLDPSQWAGQILVDQGTILEGLYGYNQKNQVVPKIAASYSVSKDGLTWTIMLRKNAKWSNGDPVTAHDFYYAWMRQLNPADSAAQLWLGIFNYVKNSYAYHSGAVPASAVGLKVVNDYEIQITTSTPHDILGELATAASMPLDEKAVNANPQLFSNGKGWVSDAPYTVQSFTPGGTLVLVKNTKYIGNPNEVNSGNAQQIDVVPATTVPVEDFMANKVDVAQVSSSSDLSYIKTHNLSSELHSAPDYSIEYLEWDNSAIASPYDNAKIRDAIAEAIQRAPIVQSVLSGMAGVTTTFSTPGWPTQRLLKGLPENLTNAKKLLAQAGYPDGKGLPPIYLYAEVPASNPQEVPVAEAVSEELKQDLGIQSKIVQLNATDDSWVTYGGPKKGIQPGFNVGASATNWNEPATIDMGGTQGTISVGNFGWTQKQTAQVLAWYNNPYDPASVKKYGNPANPQEGVKWSDWSGLIKEEKVDAAYITKWTKEQPAKWQAILQPPGTPTIQQNWNAMIQAWKSAKTPAAKHAAYVLAWEFIAPETVTASTGGINNSALDYQVYEDKNESATYKNWRMWYAYMTNSLSNAEAAPYAADILNQTTALGYTIPLYYNETYYVERKGVTGAQPNPWAWGNFYQMQYLSVK